MFKKIVVPVDLTDRHQSSIDIAIELAKQSGGELTLLHVVETIHGLPVDEQKGFYGQIERTAQSQLKRHCEVAQGRQVACRQEIVFGDRGFEIVQFAAQSAADLIVMTVPRIDPNNIAVSLGSLGYKVGLLSQCPVLLVK